MNVGPMSRRYAPTLYALYFVSGAISICYEILWSRYLALQFGVSIFGVVTTVAAFMFGLGAGSLLGTRYGAALGRPLRVFAAMELLVALFALAMPMIFQGLAGFMATLAPTLGPAQWYGLQTLIALLLLFVPACAMGFGFPNILRAAHQHDTLLGRLYGFNALGGVVGAMLPLALLPLLGWMAANQAIAGVGGVVVLAALLLDRRRSGIALDHAPVSDARVVSVRPPMTMLVAYAAVGAAALALEIAWTRMFGMVLLRTEYVLAIILAAFLSGIGAGSLLARWLSRELWLGVLPVLLAGAAAVTLWLYPNFSAWIEATPYTALSSALTVQGMALFAQTFPVTLVLGAWLPLLTRRWGGATETGALLYGVNSLGAGLGVLVTGWLLLPWLGSAGVVALAALVLLGLGLLWCSDRRFYAVTVLLIPVLYPVWQLPPSTSLLPRALHGGTDLAVREDAVAITHVVARADGQRLLLSDLQRMDASSEPEAVTLQKNQVRLPLLLHPEARSVLLLGLGTGISASVLRSLPQVEVTAVELSAGAIAAAEHWFAAVNDDVSHHITVVRDDARHFLMAAPRTYDLILGDLFHPDLVGRGALLSVQHFTRARALLNDGGLFVQWLSLNQFDLPSLQTVLATFQQSFPTNYLFMDGFRIAMVGSKDRALNFAEILPVVAGWAPQQQQALTGGEGIWTWAGRYLGGIPILPVAVQDEWAPVIEYQLPRARYQGESNLVTVGAWLVRQRLTPQQAAGVLGIPEQNSSEFSNANLASAQAHQGWQAILTDQRQVGRALIQNALQRNPADRWIAGTLAQALWDQLQQVIQRGGDVRQVFGRAEPEILAAILKIMPEHAPALKAAWRHALRTGDAAQASEFLGRLTRVAPLDVDLPAPARDRAGSSTDNITH